MSARDLTARLQRVYQSAKNTADAAGDPARGDVSTTRRLTKDAADAHRLAVETLIELERHVDAIAVVFGNGGTAELSALVTALDRIIDLDTELSNRLTDYRANEHAEQLAALRSALREEADERGRFEQLVRRIVADEEVRLLQCRKDRRTPRPWYADASRLVNEEAGPF